MEEIVLEFDLLDVADRLDGVKTIEPSAVPWIEDQMLCVPVLVTR